MNHPIIPKPGDKNYRGGKYHRQRRHVYKCVACGRGCYRRKLKWRWNYGPGEQRIEQICGRCRRRLRMERSAQAGSL